MYKVHNDDRGGTSGYDDLGQSTRSTQQSVSGRVHIVTKHHISFAEDRKLVTLRLDCVVAVGTRKRGREKGGGGVYI